MEQIGVSVLVLCYNHEAYIRDAMEGFLAQETSFPFEIIVHEDASIDRSPEILREYEEKYPEKVKVIYQTKNQYSQNVSINKEFFLPLARGKYVALCDGDDYWTDPHKLQKQFDALETHPDCSMCLHKVWDYNTLAGADQTKRFLPKKELPTGTIASDDFYALLGNGEFFNAVCYFFRTEVYREYQNNYPDFANAYMKNKTDDMPMLLYFGLQGNAYYIADEMAVYRRFNAGSWSDGQTKKSQEKLASFFRNSVEAITKFNQYSQNRFADRLNYIYRYFQFNLLACTEEYAQMLLPEFDCVWEKQSKNYKTRVRLLSKNKRFWTRVFHLYDKVRHRS